MKEGRFQNVLILLLAVAVVGMSIGFAALQSQLTINGNATFQGAKWEVIWDNNTLQETDDKDLGTVVINNNNLNIDYDVNMTPDSAYGFTVNVKNNGTFTAKLTGIVFDGKSPADVNTTYGSKLGYVFTYDNTAYTSNATPNVTIAPNESKTVTVRLTYPMPGEVTDLINSTVTEKLSVQLNFVPVTE